MVSRFSLCLAKPASSADSAVSRNNFLAFIIILNTMIEKQVVAKIPTLTDLSKERKRKFPFPLHVPKGYWFSLLMDL